MPVDELLEALRVAVGAARTTLRLDTPGMNFPCIGEACAAGVAAISFDNSLDQRGAATARWIAARHRTLVQPDVLDSDPAPPQVLIDAYGVRAQVLSPIVSEGHLVGWISAHSTHRRIWSSADVRKIDDLAARFAATLTTLRASAGYLRWLG